MRFEMFNHQEAIKIVPSAFQNEVIAAIASSTLRKPINTKSIRQSVLGKLHECGWSDGVRVDPLNSKIDITSLKSNIGLCFQTGNISRFYADMLKHQTLFADQKIIASFCIVPKRILAKKIGQNIVNFERLNNELKIFNKTITLPIIVYGIEE